MTRADSLGNLTHYAYDSRDNLASYGSQTTFDYDPDVNLRMSQNNNGLRRYFTVDELGRTTRMDVNKTEAEFGVEG